MRSPSRGRLGGSAACRGIRPATANRLVSDSTNGNVAALQAEVDQAHPMRRAGGGKYLSGNANSRKHAQATIVAQGATSLSYCYGALFGDHLDPLSYRRRAMLARLCLSKREPPR